MVNSCKWKRDLYLSTRNNNDIQLKEYCMRYSKILSKVIKTAKMLHYNNQIFHSNNKIKGESNGKLPLRTCPGCSVPEPYQSPDWALVPAKLAQGLNTNNNKIIIKLGQRGISQKVELGG
jgi:hypothetical protein